MLLEVMLNYLLKKENDNGFMISSNVTNAIAHILNKHKGSHFIFPTNCEDAATHAKHLILNIKHLKRIRTMNPSNDVDDLHECNGGRPKQVDKWLASSFHYVNNSVVEIVEGDVCSTKSFLPVHGRPAKQINFYCQNVLVHRFSHDKLLTKNNFASIDFLI